MTNRTRAILINLLGLTLIAPAAIAAPGDGLNFRPTVGDFGINYGAAANSVNVMSSGLGATMATHIGNAMAEDPKTFCNDVGVGQTSSSSNSSRSSSSASKSSGKGGGGADYLLFSVNGSGESSDSKNTRFSRSNSSSRTATIVGKDCSALLNNAAAMDMNRVDNETNRLGILVGNETQRYDVDKRFQLGLKQIQAQQVVTVFGGGANAMMGDMAK